MYFTCAQQVADLMTYAMPLCACGKKRKLYTLFMIFNRRHSMHLRTIAGYWSKNFNSRLSYLSIETHLMSYMANVLPNRLTTFKGFIHNSI